MVFSDDVVVLLLLLLFMVLNEKKLNIDFTGNYFLALLFL